MVTLPPALTPEEKEAQRQLYYAAAGRPAEKSWSAGGFPEEGVTEVLPGRAWVTRLLTEDECEDVIKRGEEHGMTGAKGGFQVG